MFWKGPVNFCDWLINKSSISIRSKWPCLPVSVLIMNQLLNLFQLIAQQETIANSLKTLDQHVAFQCLSNKQDSISISALEKYFQENNLQAAPQETFYLFRMMDRDSDQLITFKDFQGYINIKTNSKDKDVRRLMQHELYSAKLILKQLYTLKDVNIVSLFKLLSPKLSLSLNQLSEVLSKQFLKLKQHELNALFSYLDRNRDGHITIEDIQEIFYQQRVPVVLKQNQEQKLVNALYELLFIHKNLEELKFNLSECEEFDAEVAFKVFDAYGQKKVTKLDFELGCMDLGLRLKPHDVELFYLRYSEDENFLTYDEFLRAILPRPQFEEDKKNISRISQKSQLCFKQVLQRLFEAEEKIQAIKERLCSHSDFSVELAFQFIDKLKLGALTAEEFRELFDSHNIQISNQEIEQLIYMYNQNSDLKVSQSTFVSTMIPL